MHIIKNESVLTYINYSPIYKGINIAEFGKETTSKTAIGQPIQPRNNFIIHFILEGQGSFCCDGKVFTLSKNNAFIITPQNYVKYGVAPNMKWTYCWINFSGTDCSTLFKQCGFLDQNPVFEFEESDISYLLEMLTKLQEGTYEKNENLFALQIQEMCFHTLQKCAKKFQADTPGTPAASESIIDAAVSYMQNNLHRSFNISELCKKLNISRTYFSTLFETTLKQSPYQYLQNLRIQRASELLLMDKNLHICEIAEMVGFQSSAQFCKTFRRFTGVKPSEFRSKYLRK